MPEPMLWPGFAHPLGATLRPEGVNFAVYSEHASRVEVCLFDPGSPREEVARIPLNEVTGHVWHGLVPGLGAGALYGMRADGPYDPLSGMRFNRNKLLVDPYARALVGEVDHAGPIYGYSGGAADGDLSPCDRDDASSVPKAVVIADDFEWGSDARPNTPWRRSVIYEVHVRGFTMRHPKIAPELRGTFGGFVSRPALEHLTRLGVTAVELLPVQESADEPALRARGLRNYWGYCPLAFFAPAQRFATGSRPGDAVRELKAMVKALHEAGIEVILDVVLDHTCEGDHLGPTLSWRGLENASYYKLLPERRYYADFTRTGNSLDVSHPQTLKLVMDCLRYWVTEMHVDGFRFDHAPTLCRNPVEFDRASNFLQTVHQDPTLATVKLIAQPWDHGPQSDQAGSFPVRWSEWNGRYRDAVRRFWRGERNVPELGYRLTGSSDLYQHAGRKIYTSINYVTCHDGFTLRDLVSYDRKHNEANGECNRDGPDDDASWNCGFEGLSDDAGIKALRDRQQRNMLATLFLSQGVPMLAAGDESGKTQGGNNNAFCQDNETSWLEWALDDRRIALLGFTRRLIRLRLAQHVLLRRHFFRGAHLYDSSLKDLAWFRPDGEEFTEQDWVAPHVRSLAFLLGGDAIGTPDEHGERVVGDTLLVLMNADAAPVAYRVPEITWGAEWDVLLDTAGASDAKRDRIVARGVVDVAARSLVVLSRPYRR